MCSKKKDLEIICNLQWKNKVHNGGENSNIVGVYDVPSTTLNWEIFKSYLLKNSGTPGDDVKVSYVTTNDREFPIQSQLDFQIALYAFRKKARNGEIINLKLDRISAQGKSPEKIVTSNIQVQTQFDSQVEAGTCATLDKSETAPQWFTDYMSEFKKNLLDEVSTTVSSYVSSIKSHSSQSYHSRKSKTESGKRTRKHPVIFCEFGNEKEFLKTLKMEKKVETKLEKLECKSKKLKEKKISLLTKSSDSDAGHSSSKSNPELCFTFALTQMNAAPVRYQQAVVPHLVGGEVYFHSWDVINNGSLPWTADTELHFTWGSASLEPVERVVPCPPLKPGESGLISVLLNVPKACGQYESYWYFHHKGRKFGHWLGCQIIVDKINSTEPMANTFLDSYELLRSRYDSLKSTQKIATDCKVSCNKTDEDSFEVLSNTKIQMNNQACAIEIPGIEEKVKDLMIAEASSSSDNGHNSSGDKIEHKEFIFVTKAPNSVSTEMAKNEQSQPPRREIEEMVVNASPSRIQIVEKFLNDVDSRNTKGNMEETVNDFEEPNQNKQIEQMMEKSDNNNNTDGGVDSSSESISKIEDDTSSNSTLNDMVMVNFADGAEDHDTGYAYVLVDGTKVPIPKKFLRTDFLETAEDAPDPTKFVRIGELNTVDPFVHISSEEFKPAVQETNIHSTEINPTIDQIGEPFEHITSEQIKPVVMELKSQSPISNEGNPFRNKNNLCSAPVRHVNYKFLSDEAQKVNESVCSGPSDGTMQDKTNPRMFIFPQNCPGYEVIPPHSDSLEIIKQSSDANWATSKTQYSFSNDDESKNQFLKCNVYNQDPSDTNQQSEFLPQPTFSSSLFTNASSQQNSAHIDNSAAFYVPPNYTLGGNFQMNSGESSSLAYVPNYQQTPPELRPPLRGDKEEINYRPEPEKSKPTPASTSQNSENTPQNVPTASAAVPISSVVSGAMTMASSALNTAKNVVHMIIPTRNENEPGMWINGHWVVTNPETPREANLQALAEMGFWDRDLNATLLARYNDDIALVVSELV